MDIAKETAFSTLIEDAANAIASSLAGPADELDHAWILAGLRRAAPSFPPTYQAAISDPLLATFERIGAAGWADVLRRDPGRQSIALLGLDLVQTQIQRAEGYRSDATQALQEVVSDLYDGFLSAADRDGVKPPDFGVAPPLVKWGRPSFGPYAWTVPAASTYGCSAGVVNMPPAFADAGLAAWSALGHETAGHHILHADKGLHEALQEAVAKAIMTSRDKDLADKSVREGLAQYWSERIDESASDVMGVVNMGPAAPIGLMGYFRAIGLLFSGEARLSPYGTAGEHPAPLARAWLMAEAIGKCSFAKSSAWRSALMREADLDAPAAGLTLAGRTYSADAVRAAARNAASAILTAKVAPLEDHALIEIQDWRQSDQQIVEGLTIHAFLRRVDPPQMLFNGIYAAHAVAAAINSTLMTGKPNEMQSRMIEIVARMHGANPTWSAIGPTVPGDVIGVHLSGASGWHAALHRGCDCNKPAPGSGAGSSGDTGGFSVPVLFSDAEDPWPGGPNIPVPVAVAGTTGWTKCGGDVIADALSGARNTSAMQSWTLRRTGLVAAPGAPGDFRRSEHASALSEDLTQDAIGLLVSSS